LGLSVLARSVVVSFGEGAGLVAVAAFLAEQAYIPPVAVLEW
jgi:predicted nicotinamide N-methyase